MLAVEIGTYKPKRNRIQYSRTRRFKCYDEALKYYKLLVDKGLPALFEVGIYISLWAESKRYRQELSKVRD